MIQTLNMVFLGASAAVAGDGPAIILVALHTGLHDERWTWMRWEKLSHQKRLITALALLCYGLQSSKILICYYNTLNRA